MDRLHQCIDVNGNFVDGDRRVVFVSDRLGYPNVFAQNVDGSGFEQMVYHGKNNNSVSTYQNYIVYSSREDDKSGFGTRDFNIYMSREIGRASCRERV